MQRAGVVVGAMALLVVLGGCGQAQSSVEAAPPVAAEPESMSTLVPDLAGLAAGDVIPELTAVGLNLGATTYEESDKPVETVVSQDPPVGAAVMPGSTVSVVLAKARPTEEPIAKQGPLVTTDVVTRVIDGDTIDVGGDRIRVIGIDSPERGECGYERATEAMQNLVGGATVTLTSVDTKDNKDRYDRLLRYVDVGGRDAGLGLLQRGLAIARYDSRDGYGEHPREAEYITADAAAPDITCASQPQPKQVAPAPVPAPKQQASNCDPSYPGVCIPQSPPDLDCGDIGERRFAVVGSDPHRFDGDNNGIGCESG